MIQKWKINLIAFLISLTLFSVGFSSWQITGGMTLTENGTITVDSVAEPPASVASLIKFNEDKPVVCFEYDSNGFIERDQLNIPSIVNTATVTANFTLYPQELQKYFGTNKTIFLEAVLTYKNTQGDVDLFGTNCDYTPTAVLNEKPLGYLSTSHTNGYKFSVVLTDILNETVYTKTVTQVPLSLNFTFIVKENLKDFCTAISNENFKFNVSATVNIYTEKTGGTL